MALVIEQEASYEGADRWKWSVWLEGPATELDSLDHVTYILHPTFYQPVREVSDRRTKFRLDTSGWGTFTIHAKAKYKDGREIVLDHDLDLRYPNGIPTTA